MADKNFRDLTLYTLGVVSEGTARLQLLLSKHDHLLNNNDRQVADWITLRLLQIQGELHARCLMLQNLESDNDLLWSTFFLLLSQITSLEKAHAALKHVTIPKLLRDTTILLGWFWRGLNIPGKVPALALSDEIEPSEHGIGDDSDGDAIGVVTIAKLDYANPSAWPLVVHELGHRVIPKLNLFGKTISDVHKNWLIEFGCDRIGMRLVGPAYFAALANRAITKTGYFVGSSVHPPPFNRIESILATMDPWQKATPLVKRLRRLHELRVAAERKNNGGELPDVLYKHCELCGSVNEEIPRRESPRMVRQRERFFSRLDAVVDLKPFRSANYAIASKMKPRFDRGYLVSATHRQPDNAASILKATRAKLRKNPSEARSDFTKLVERLCDKPHETAEIITGALIFRTATIGSRVQTHLLTPHGPFSVGWSDFREDVGMFDELILASIETAEFHRELTAPSGV